MDGVLNGLQTPAGGWGYEDPSNLLTMYLRQNVYAFSAAKSLTQMQLFNELLTKTDGQLRSKAEFIAEVAKTGAEFNKQYLGVEYNSSIAQAQMAQVWQEIGEVIEIRTMGDDRVRKWHAALDKVTFRKSDAVARRIWPPFDWECRCYAMPGLEKNVKEYHAAGLIKEARIPDYFQSNSGITKTVFEDGHHYFKNAFRQTKEYNAVDNYAMPTVKKLYVANDFPPARKQSEIEAMNWWGNKTGDKEYIDLKDVNGDSLRFDKRFKKHVMDDNADKRHTILSNFEDVVTAPDEVWSIRKKDRLITTYIRYYDNAPICVRVENGRAFTMFAYEHEGKLNESGITAHRRGTLLYRKN